MFYTSTRDKSVSVGSKQAISQGISKDGGLFVPQSIPTLSYDELCALSTASYPQRAEMILGKFLSDYTLEEIRDCVTKAYTGGKFEDDENVAPVVEVGNYDYFLELWHGPTCAFKDMALQLLPHLLTTAAKQTSGGKDIVILVATSGDTGKAALEGFKDVDKTKIIVFYPEDGVSAMQKLQMVTQEGGNVSVCAIKGNFDDAQTSVKKIFTDPEVNALLAKNNMQFSSANSINWGRLVPQIVYYFTAYMELMETGEMDYKGERVNIVVPTGNFGNILAAYYAMKMGLPVNKLICASNANNILTDFIETGVYDKNRGFHTTISPSMDILISSNLERLLYHLSGENDVKVKGWMESLATTGRYEVDEDMKKQIKDIFFAGYCDDEQTKATIKELFDGEGYLCDTHSAVAYNVCKQYREKTGDYITPTIIASTASPFKFSSSVLEAISGGAMGNDEFQKVHELSAMSGMTAPEALASLKNKQVRFNNVCTDETMKQTVLDMLGIK